MKNPNKIFIILLLLIVSSYILLSRKNVSSPNIEIVNLLDGDISENQNLETYFNENFKYDDIKKKKKNLLFIIYDDLRPELSIYGKNYMKTNNFERLANQSVTFDRSIVQVSVCNPSRNSILTGLRPDYGGSVNFEGGLGLSDTIPKFLKKNGYNTAQEGKIFHWEKSVKDAWTYPSKNKDWFSYQNMEENYMNSTVFPDKTLPLEKFRDSIMVKNGLKVWQDLIEAEEPWMMSFGFKLPHLSLHLPYQFYEIYKDLDIKNFLSSPNSTSHLSSFLRFPLNSSTISYNGFILENFQYISEEGKDSNREQLTSINKPVPTLMYEEIMRGYLGSVSFLDHLLGEILDFMDNKDLWKDTVVVLTSDHGMHNGEKGIWNKWTLFDESTRVPLLISSPSSPFKGKRYEFPVELTDIYPTIIDLLELRKAQEKTNLSNKSKKKKIPDGVSLAPIILGDKLFKKIHHTDSNNFYYLDETYQAKSTLPDKGIEIERKNSSSISMPILFKNYSISQLIKCSYINDIDPVPLSYPLRSNYNFADPTSISNRTPYSWRDCSPKFPNNTETYNYHDLVRGFQNNRESYKAYLQNLKNESKEGTIDLYSQELVLMGYSMRTIDFRYTSYFFFDRLSQRPILNALPFDEELYDHRNDEPQDFNRLEYINLAALPEYSSVVLNHREVLIEIIKKFKFINRGLAHKQLSNSYFSNYQP